MISPFLIRQLYTLNTDLSGKAASSHTHSKSQITDFSHTHDDRYYTDDEVDNLLGSYIQSKASTAFTKITEIAKYSDSNNMHVQTTGTNYIVPLVVPSDEHIKDNIEDTKIKALDIINSIRHASFNYTHSEFGSHSDIGYIAQELIKLVPEAVISVPQDKTKYGYDELYQINYIALIPYLTKAVQELTEKVNSLVQSSSTE